MADLKAGDDAGDYEINEALASDAHAETPAWVNSMGGPVNAATLHALSATACHTIHVILSLFANAQSHKHE